MSKKLSKADKALLNGRSIAQAARDAGLTPEQVHTRRHAGWTLERALTTPSKPRKKKAAAKKEALPKVTNPLASDSAVPGFTDPMDEHLTLASTSQRTLNGDGPIVDPDKDIAWIWGLLIIGALGLGIYGLLHGLGGT